MSVLSALNTRSGLSSVRVVAVLEAVAFAADEAVPDQDLDPRGDNRRFEPRRSRTYGSSRTSTNR